ncbi:MAG TPA: zinc ribbon domain-containing protein, partial [Sandaracinaceae bacterium]
MATTTKCEACGAELDADSKFCDQCAAPTRLALERASTDGSLESEAHDAPNEDGAVQVAGGGDRDARAKPGSARIVSVVVAVLALLLIGVSWLSRRPTVRFEVIEPPDVADGAGARSPPRELPPERAPTDSERALAGTWVATGSFDVPRPAAGGSVLLEAQAIQQGRLDPVQRCIWLELYENLRGFQHECAVAGGEPTVLERTDPVTGRSSPHGVAFRWSVENGALRLEYDEDMIAGVGGGSLRFRRT